MPILLASGHAELPERNGHAIPRLTKPFRQDELENAIASVVTPACKPVKVVPSADREWLSTGRLL
jgi:hypothetical protein